MLDDVVRASERAAELTNQLLAYAGKGRFYVQPVDLAALVQELSGLLRSSISRKVALELELPAGLPPVEADSSQLQQLVMNLIINGAEAIGESAGEVRLTAATETLDDGAARRAFPDFDLVPGRYVRLEVADDGEGMDAATQARMFDPFFTTKFTGRGLGLAAALGIVRGHRGAIGVRSRPGEGTVFTVLLPVAPDVGTSAVAPGAAAPGAAERPRPANVLVVDDEPMVRELAQLALGDAGYDVVVAADGAEAVERFAERPDRFDLVLLDLTMPVMNGEEALARLQAIRRGVRVVVMSGYGEVGMLDRLAGREVRGVVPKPFSPDALVDAVRVALR
jgi:CheY-like chemotaxis protein